MALDAYAGRLVRQLVAGILKLAFAGSVLRLVLAVSATRRPGGPLFQIDAPDPLTSLGVSLVLGVAALRIDCAPPPTWSRCPGRITRQA